jgi:hypothetical protein
VQVTNGVPTNINQRVNERNATQPSEQGGGADGHHDLTAEQRRDISEEDINIFLSNEGVENNKNIDNNCDSQFKPELGLQFVSRDEARGSSTCMHTLLGFQSASGGA